jgi:carbamoyl-phosphate synthase small subunit
VYLGEIFLRKPALLALQDGNLFWGESIGADGVTAGEVVFNTAITGYQEILTDPSYCQQIVTLTYPHIGNVGTNHCDEESRDIFASGLVVRDCPTVVSNWRSEQSLDDYLQSRKVVAIAAVDTRRLTRLVREKGAQNGCIMAGDNVKAEQALAAARSFPGLMGMDLAKVVSTQQSYTWTEGAWQLASNQCPETQPSSFHVVAYDYGIKRNILRVLTEHGCRVTVVPAELPATQVLNLQPDGVFLSNGPGDPEPCDYAIAAIQALINAQVPIFGICLGHQLLGLASGARTVKMKFGHHGANHPVQDLLTRQVIISSQNHGFAVDETSLPDCLRATHRSLFDGSLQGIERLDCPAFSFQGHPEASPGPHDVGPLFKRFIDMMVTYQGKKVC